MEQSVENLVGLRPLLPENTSSTPRPSKGLGLFNRIVREDKPDTPPRKTAQKRKRSLKWSPPSYGKFGTLDRDYVGQIMAEFYTANSDRRMAMLKSTKDLADSKQRQQDIPPKEEFCTLYVCLEHYMEQDFANRLNKRNETAKHINGEGLVYCLNVVSLVDLKHLDPRCVKVFDRACQLFDKCLMNQSRLPAIKLGQVIKPAPKVAAVAFIRHPKHKDVVPSIEQLNSLQPNAKLKVVGRETIYREDLLKVLTQAWLNDTAINAFFSLLATAANQEALAKSGDIEDATVYFHAFSSHWYSSMVTKPYDTMRGWARRAKIAGLQLLSVRKLFIPVNLHNTHWVLVIVEPTKKRVRLFDSMAKSIQIDMILEHVNRFLEGELGQDYIGQGWHCALAPSKQQVNGHDCGVFTCLNGLSSLYGDPYSLLPTDVALEDGRLTLAAILMNGFTGEYGLAQYYPGLDIR